MGPLRRVFLNAMNDDPKWVFFYYFYYSAHYVRGRCSSFICSLFRSLKRFTTMKYVRKHVLNNQQYRNIIKEFTCTWNVFFMKVHHGDPCVTTKQHINVSDITENQQKLLSYGYDITRTSANNSENDNFYFYQHCVVNI